MREAAKTLALIGHPVAHSASPAIHNAVFKKLGLNWKFEMLDFAHEDQASAYLKGDEYFGLSVTTPYKPLAARSVDVCAASAKLAGGVNLIVSIGEKHLGYNVDGRGMVSYLEHSGVDFRGKSVVVCGTGPTSHACYHASAQAGADKVIMLSREKERAHAAVDAYLEAFGDLAHATINPPAEEEGHRSFREAYDDVRFLFGSYGTSRQSIESADIIIDATTLGMGKDDPAPFDVGLLSARQTVFDVVYARETQLLSAASSKGCTVFDGSAMLLGQAVIAQRTWLSAAGIEESASWEDLIGIMRKAGRFKQ